MRLVFLGPPGAGKGTQAELLRKRRRVVWLAAGDILREAVRRGDPVGERAFRYMERGALVPDDLITGKVLEKLKGLAPDQSFVLDGFPRTEWQALQLDAMLAQSGQKPLDLVVDFEMTEEKIIRRLADRRICKSCGANYHQKNLKPRRQGVCDFCGGTLEARVDDQPDTIRRRLVVYHEQTEPLLKFYRTQGKLKPIPGDLEIESQYETLIGLLEKERLVA